MQATCNYLDFEQETYNFNMDCEIDAIFNPFESDIFKQCQQEKNMVIDEIEELEEQALQQQKEIDELKERNEIMKYNIKQKEKVKKHVSSVYGFSFESSSFPIVILGKNSTILSWNKAAAVSFFILLTNL
jgi:hypothetical protein